jgi:rare lipoprotein A
MRGVAGRLPNVRPLTLAAAFALAGVTVAAALFVAHTIVAPDRPAAPRLAKAAPAPRPALSHKAESEHAKTPRLTLDEPRAWQASVAPELAPDDAARIGALPPAAPDDGAETGRASWYALPGATASGEAMDETALTAAHPTLALGSEVLVENLDNGRAVVVRINDRGPFVGDRIIDLSKGAAQEIGMVEAGVADVRVRAIDTGATGAVNDLVAGGTLGRLSPLSR